MSHKMRWGFAYGMIAIAASLVLPIVAHAAAGDADTVGKMLYVWHLDEGSGQTVSEANGKGPDGALKGDLKWTDGISGSALTFAGTAADPEYIDFPGDKALDITQGLTMAAWIDIDAIPPAGDANKDTIVFKNTYYFQIEPATGQLAYYFYDATPPGYFLSAGTVTTGKWEHVAATWDGTTQKFYFNGELDATQTPQAGPGRSTPTKDVQIGGENNACCPRFFQGKIDDLAIANYALTQAQIKDLMDKALTVEPRGKLATVWASLKTR